MSPILLSLDLPLLTGALGILNPGVTTVIVVSVLALSLFGVSAQGCGRAVPHCKCLLPQGVKRFLIGNHSTKSRDTKVMQL